MLKWLKAFRNRLVASLPSTQLLFRRANRAIEEASLIKQASGIERIFEQEIALQQANLRARMNDILALRTAEAACVSPERVEKLTEGWAPAENLTQFKERLWELELALEDRGWVREIALSGLEFSRLGVQQLCRISRIYAIKNPIIKRGAEIVAMYVFGRGVEIRSEDDTENEVIQAFIDANKNNLGHVGLAQKERAIQTDGAVYWGLPTDPSGTVKVQIIDPLEIMDMVTDPDDTSVPRYFLRQWTRYDTATTTAPQPMQSWYPAMEYVIKGPESKLATIQGKPVNWDMPIYRSSAGACPANWRWPIPPLYASIDWSRAYKDFLEDWATVQRTLSRFALMIETKGGAGAIAAYNALLNTTFADGLGTQIERNPPPVTGSAHISGPGNQVTPLKTAGSKDSPEQARRLLLMAAAAQGLPETFYGDASTGSLATAQSLDRPTELKFRECQQRWIEVLTNILTYVLLANKSTPGSLLREAQKGQPAKKPSILIKFPAVLEHDVLNMIQAWSGVAAMGGRMGIAAGIVDRRTIADGLLAEIGYENRGKLLDQIYGTDYDPAKDVTDQRTQVPPQSLKTATGKPMTDLGTGIPLPPPPPAPAPIVMPHLGVSPIPPKPADAPADK